MGVQSKINKAKKLYFLVGISVLFFLVKGIVYLLIGSYTPILFISVLLLLLLWSLSFKSKNHYRWLKFWAILIIIWAVIRLGLWLVLQIDTNLTESHLREQFTIFQHLISFAMLITGFLIFKQLKKIKNSPNAEINM